MTETARFKRKLVRSDLERMNLPEEHWHSKVQGVSDESRPAVERYLTRIDTMVGTGAGLLIHGPTGSGKTTVAVLIAKEARSWGFMAFFMRVWELREMIRSKVHFSDDLSMLDRAREVDVLVLDDLREEDVGEKFFGLADIYELVRYRASRRKITVLTTRMTMRMLDSPPMDKFSEVLLPFPVLGANRHRDRQQALKRVVFGQ